jgi:cell division protein FtsQ
VSLPFSTRAILALAALGSAVVIPSGAAAFLLLRPDLVLVEHVEFSGVRNADQRALRHLAGIENGTTMWGVDLAAARAGVLHHPWIRGARAERIWPDTVRITVDERTPVALLSYGSTWYVDELGEPFLEATSGDLDYPLITGIDPSLEQKHPDLPRLAVRDALWLLSTLPARHLVPADAVSQIDFSSRRGWTMTVGRSQLVFGLEDLPRQADRLERLERDQGIDLSQPILVDLAPETVAIVRPLSPGNAI